MTISTNAEKIIIWQKPTIIHTKNKTQQSGVEGNCLKEHLQKPTFMSYLMVNFVSFSLKSGIRQECLLSPLFFNIVLAVSASVLSKKKINKRHTNLKGIKHSVLTNDMIIDIENLKKSTQKNFFKIIKVEW